MLTVSSFHANRRSLSSTFALFVSTTFVVFTFFFSSAANSHQPRYLQPHRADETLAPDLLGLRRPRSRAQVPPSLFRIVVHPTVSREANPLTLSPLHHLGQVPGPVRAVFSLAFFHARRQISDPSARSRNVASSGETCQAIDREEDIEISEPSRLTS